MSDQGPRKPPSIPAWQQNYKSSSKQEASPSQSIASEPPSLEQAEKLLEDDSMRDAPHERKVEFLQSKGLQADDIEKLLGPSPSSSSSDDDDSVANTSTSELKTIHDTTQTPSREEERKEVPTSSPPTLAESTPPSVSPKRDIAPIITYPEFLLKPQKPPPLITLERLANAAYAFAGFSALTWGASRYIVQPMLESLTEARHSLVETAKSDLETLNTKLESTVSHVPYIPSLAVQQQQQNQKSQQEDDEDLESTDSDPTELFHRDIATQTSPTRSRTHSPSSDYSAGNLPAQDPTTSQSSRIRSLHATLSSLLSSQTTQFSHDRLSTTITDFQSTLTRLETTYNPFETDYSKPYASSTGASSGAREATGEKTTVKKTDNEATKFKNEIRSLKGAFLSSRNFPTARPAQPFTLPAR